MKIAHISDIHVRNYKYHYEYKQVFDQLFDKLKELKPDVIVNTGDTAHTKSKLSPEYFKMTAYLFENLANIAPFHVILGNHDVNVKNPHRLDAVSPIVNAVVVTALVLAVLKIKFPPFVLIGYAVAIISAPTCTTLPEFVFLSFKA